MIRVGINGFGRIGRSVFRAIYGPFYEGQGIEVVAINDIFSNQTLAYLLQYDTVMGIFSKKVTYDAEALYVDGHKVIMAAQKDPSQIAWGAWGVDIVLESTGVFASRAALEKHLHAGAKRVLLSVPPKDAIDNMVVMGVNDDSLQGAHRLVSNASCTTNCLAPMAKVLHEVFGIERGVMTTVHATTNDQRLLDMPHSDWRRSRAANDNILLTTTGAARAVGKVLPQLQGKLDGIAARVPVSDGSLVDLTVQLAKSVTRDEINQAIQRAAKGALKGIVQYSEAPLVSRDIVGNRHSSIFDSELTQASGDGFARVVSWYDNEWGYSNRCVDVMIRMAALD